MKLNIGMMVDGNSRFAFVEALRHLGRSPGDLASASVLDDVMAEYARRLSDVYIRNARWCIALGEELHSRVEDSDYSIFVYNVANRKRDHFSCIDNAIRTVGGELVDRLSEYGPVCLVGPKAEKETWFSLFPGLRELEPPSKGNRTVILTGYQHGSGEDPLAQNMRPIDFFIRSTQMRFSGMYVPALANSQFIVLSHIPYQYSPRSIADTLVETLEADEEHDELNVYSPRVYDKWSEHFDKAPQAFITSNALPPATRAFAPSPTEENAVAEEAVQ